MPLVATAIVGIVGVSLAGANGLANTAVHQIGRQTANSAAIPAELHSELASLITAWRNLSQPLQTAFNGQAPLLWETQVQEVADRHLTTLYSICNHWDTTILSMREATTSLEGAKASRIAVSKLHQYFRVLLQVLEEHFSNVMLDPARKQHKVLFSRVQGAQDWLDKEYPVVKTEQGLVLKSIAWSSTLAGLRVSGGRVAICSPDRVPGINVTFGSGGAASRNKGWVLIKHLQGGWPEVLSCPSGIHPTSWHRNATKRSQSADFADWDLWELMPAFDGEIPGVDYPGKMLLRVGDAVKLSPAYVCEALSGTNDPEEVPLLRGNVLEEISGKELQLATDAASSTLVQRGQSKLVIAREFWWVLCGCPKLTMRPYQRHHHETTTFVVREV